MLTWFYRLNRTKLITCSHGAWNTTQSLGMHYRKQMCMVYRFAGFTHSRNLFLSTWWCICKASSKFATKTWVSCVMSYQSRMWRLGQTYWHGAFECPKQITFGHIFKSGWAGQTTHVRKNMSQVPSGLKHGIFQHWTFAPHLAGKKIAIFPEKGGAKFVTDLRPVVDTRFCMFIPQAFEKHDLREVWLWTNVP